jgi:2,5-diamino-6-(ribosylamino)-4(3H)-pyrimidinone 5'-phosphate reductase
MNMSKLPENALNRPRILVNVAMTVDGKMDTASRRGATLSSPEDKQRVDRLRAGVDAIMVGGKTLLQEDPRLTIKSEVLRRQRERQGKPENPAKVGVVSFIGEADLPAPCDFLGAGPAEIILFTTGRTAPETIRRLEECRARVHILGDKWVDLSQALYILQSEGIRTLLVEGGGTLLAEVFRLDVVDEVTAYISPRIFGGASAPTLADGAGFNEEIAPHCKLLNMEKMDDDGGILLHYEVIHKE